MVEPAAPEHPPRRERSRELLTFLILAFGIWPLLAVAVVGGHLGPVAVPVALPHPGAGGVGHVSILSTVAPAGVRRTSNRVGTRSARSRTRPSPRRSRRPASRNCAFPFSPWWSALAARSSGGRVPAACSLGRLPACCCRRVSNGPSGREPDARSCALEPLSARLRASGNAYYAVRRCSLFRTGQTTVTGTTITPRLQADCELDLITVMDRAAK